MTASQSPIQMPLWAAQWPSVETEVRRAEGRCLPGEHHAVLLRLATDPRMQAVWNELVRRKRLGEGYFHAVQGTDAERLPLDRAQEKALGETMHFAFVAAIDQVSVSKEDEITPVRVIRNERAITLRTVADELELSVAHEQERCARTQHGGITPAARSIMESNFALYTFDVAALRRVAGWYDAQTETLRTPDDPMTVTNDRGDRVSRGVSIMIASFLKERFGKPLYGTAATLASVALNRYISERVVRSAFSRPD